MCKTYRIENMQANKGGWKNVHSVHFPYIYLSYLEIFSKGDPGLWSHDMFDSGGSHQHLYLMIQIVTESKINLT